MKLTRDKQKDIDHAIKNLAHKNSIIMTEEYHPSSKKVKVQIKKANIE